MTGVTKGPFPGRIGRTIAESAPWWPPRPAAPGGAPNILIVLFDDVGFSDFGCYGSPIKTPTIDAIAANGLRYSGFHTTAMCSTTRSALLTGRNHHSVGMGCLANFDSGYPGYRGKISREAGTLAEVLRTHAYRNYMVGKWHVTPLTEAGATGPFDGWPLGRGFDRFYGFLDAETDHFAPELVLDNTCIDAPATFGTGYHLTADLIDQSMRFIANHIAELPDTPWLTWIALGACHAPHQAPADLIRSYDAVFAGGWDAERERRLARQKEMGIVPPGTVLPARNDNVAAWESHSEDERRLFVRLQSAYAAMLDHADQQLARLMALLGSTGQLENTIVLVLSDNGASQEGGPLGFVNSMGQANQRPETFGEKLARIEDIGGPGTNANYPFGWAMAGNTPLRRYKQNTHGGGIRDPLIISWPSRIAVGGELRHQFAHASDLTPTLLDLIGIEPPAAINGVPQMPIEGTSFAASLFDASLPSKSSSQYFEMFGHRGLWQDGWKAVAYHAPGTPFDADKWELFHLDEDFSESNDLSSESPEKLKELVDKWWEEAAAHQVLPLDDRFGPRFAETVRRVQGTRKRFVFHHGMGHVPTDVAPDVRSRNYTIEADVEVPPGGGSGVLIAHGDATSGYSLFLRDGHLVHVLNIGGERTEVVSSGKIEPGDHRLGVKVRRLTSRLTAPSGPGLSEFVLVIDGESAGRVETPRGFALLISFSGLDIGRDRGSPVGDYEAPFEFTGLLRHVTVTMDDIQDLDEEGVVRAQTEHQ